MSLFMITVITFSMFAMVIAGTIFIVEYFLPLGLWKQKKLFLFNGILMWIMLPLFTVHFIALENNKAVVKVGEKQVIESVITDNDLRIGQIWRQKWKISENPFKTKYSGLYYSVKDIKNGYIEYYVLWKKDSPTSNAVINNMPIKYFKSWNELAEDVKNVN